MTFAHYSGTSNSGTAWPFSIITLILAFIVSCAPMYAQSGASSGSHHFPGSTDSSPSTRSSDCDLIQGSSLPTTLSKKMQEQREEWALGKKLAADAERHLDFVTQDFLLRYVNRLEWNIVKSSGLSGCFIVKILLDSEPNAYSLPGGFVYLTTGLIDAVESEGQLVSALAHETGHITARHLTRVETQIRVWRRLALTGGPATYVLQRLLGPLLLLNLLRNKEFEADQLGLDYAVAAGYDPIEFCGLLLIAFPDDEHGESFFEHLYDTHPSTNARITRLQAVARMMLLANTTYVINTSDFTEMKMRFAVMMGGTH